MKARRKQALEDWDRRRQADGLGKWDVIYQSSIPGNFRYSFSCAAINLLCFKDKPFGRSDESSFHEVKPHIRESPLIHIPIMSIPPRPLTPHADDIEDWNESMNGLFEWVGMACLGAQR